MGWKAECHSLGLKGEFQGYVFFRLLVWGWKAECHSLGHKGE